MASSSTLHVLEEDGRGDGGAQAHLVLVLAEGEAIGGVLRTMKLVMPREPVALGSVLAVMTMTPAMRPEVM